MLPHDGKLGEVNQYAIRYGLGSAVAIDRFTEETVIVRCHLFSPFQKQIACPEVDCLVAFFGALGDHGEKVTVSAVPRQRPVGTNAGGNETNEVETAAAVQP